MIIGEGTLFSWRDNYHADSKGNRVPVVMMIVCMCMFLHDILTCSCNLKSLERERMSDFGLAASFGCRKTKHLHLDHWIKYRWTAVYMQSRIIEFS